ncbi:MAG: hypothetical protein ACYS8W_00190 [Planctomycetota bacterium]|jgi:hypothetical protein
MNIAKLLVSWLVILAFCLPVSPGEEKDPSAEPGADKAAQADEDGAKKEETEKDDKAKAAEEKRRLRKERLEKARNAAQKKEGVVIGGGGRKINIRVGMGGAVQVDSLVVDSGSKNTSGAKGRTSFDLPRELPNGAVAKFHNAEDEASISYSGGTELRMYIYEDREKLDSDFTMFAEKMEKVTEADSKKLAEKGAVIERSEKKSAIYFVFQEIIIAFTFKGGTDGADMIAAGEAFLDTEEERRARIFATPESTFETARKAVSEYDFATLRIAFLDNVSSAARDHIERLRTEYANMRSRSGFTYRNPSTDIDAELESENENEAVFAIKSVSGTPLSQSRFINVQWVRAICGRRPYFGTQIMGYRCFLVKKGNRWYIDLDANLAPEAEIQLESEVDKLTEAEKKITKVLRIIYEFQAAYFAEDFDGDRKRDYATSVEDLVSGLGEKGEMVKQLLENSGTYIVKISAKDGEAHWYATAEPKSRGQARTNVRIGGAAARNLNAKHFYIDETGIVRFERGKPANSKSGEYKE